MMRVSAHLVTGVSVDLDLTPAAARRWVAALRPSGPATVSGPRWQHPGTVTVATRHLAAVITSEAGQ